LAISILRFWLFGWWVQDPIRLNTVGGKAVTLGYHAQARLKKENDVAGSFNAKVHESGIETSLGKKWNAQLRGKGEICV